MNHRVTKDWLDKTVVIIASGPSLTADQIKFVEERKSDVKIIVLCATYAFVPFADVIYFCDAKFYTWHMSEPAFINHPAEKISLMHGATDGFYPVKIMKQGEQYGLSHEPDTLNTGGNSGFQAMNLAYLRGANRIILLGMDMKTGKDGRTHHHAGHPSPTPPSVYKHLEKGRFFESIATDLFKEEVEVINSSPDSAIHCFTKLPLEEAFK